MTQEKTLEIVTQTVPTEGPKYTRWLWVLGGILVIAWFALGIYLHVQVVQSRAKVEQNRLEAQRREEVMRRGVQYKQELEQRNQAPRVRNVFDGR